MEVPETVPASSSSLPPCVSEPEESDALSSQFNAGDADITFKSADGILYLIHRKNLDCGAAGFPPAEFKSSKDDIVPMTELSHVLDLLFTFMYPMPTPDVKNLPFDVLAVLAEATEKYQVFSAMTLCNIYMSAAVNEHPIEVLRYAALHNYVELLDTAATLAIGRPLDSVVTGIPSNAVIAWVKYHQKWLEALAETSTYSRTAAGYCTSCTSRCLMVLERLGGKVQSLTNLESVFSFPDGCSRCSIQFTNWRHEAQNICKRVPKFSILLFPSKSRPAPVASRKKLMVGGKGKSKRLS